VFASDTLHQKIMQYRIYRIKDDHVDGPPTVIEADVDDAAVLQLRQRLDGADLELWQAARFVIGLRGKPSSANNPACQRQEHRLPGDPGKPR
jgi:hypothetical protein